jgi:phage anti-repressor protein
MKISQLTENVIFDFINSENNFPIDFDLAHKWIGFSRKDAAKRSLFDCGFVEGIDLHISVELGTLDAPRSKEKIFLSVDCFKSWGMMVRTDKGKEVRKYFLECERKMKQLAANPIRTDWVLSDLMENDVLASAVAALSQLFLSMGKDQKQGKSSDINYADIGNALWVAAMTIQSPSPQTLDEEAPWTPEVEFDNQRWCSMFRDALLMLSPAQAAKYLAEVAEKNPSAGYFRNFPTSVAIPGYQRGDGKVFN